MPNKNITPLQLIKSALISVFYKDGMDNLVKFLDKNGVKIYSTGGTQKHIEKLGISVIPVEVVTGYPSILGGRVKTLHPNVFGGILARREVNHDMEEIKEYNIPLFDLVMVDLYPFDETVKNTNEETEIIEKIDIGGVSLIRAAGKNYKHTAIVSNKTQYDKFLTHITNNNNATTKEFRRELAGDAFHLTARYDRSIANYFSGIEEKVLRYGENPHQTAVFKGDINDIFHMYQGKELSYNNMLDTDAAMQIIQDFDPSNGATFVIIKHNNACGLAQRETVEQAYKDALAGDPTSAFGGILVCNQAIDVATAEHINKLFFEIIIAPDYQKDALKLLSSKKSRRILKKLKDVDYKRIKRSNLNGILIQDYDSKIDAKKDFEIATNKVPTDAEMNDMEFGIKISKNSKSNTIILVKDRQLLASGVGQTSRVDALNQAIDKAKKFNFDLNGAVMISDAFFPFPDCVEIAGNEGITAISQPGGSIKDQLSIDYCNANNLGMVMTGVRHFKH